MKKASLICIVVSFIIACWITIANNINDGETRLFISENTSEYRYGVVYSFHSQDAVVQIYSHNGELISTDLINDVRACGLCSSSGKPMIKHGNTYYYVSDAAFDPNVSNCIIKLDADKLTYECIDLNMDKNFTYVFTIDDSERTAYAYYSGAPEWGCVYSTEINGDSYTRYAFHELQNYKEYISETAHFWPLDMVCYEDTNYYVGYIVDSYERKLCIASVKDSVFTVESMLEGYLYADGSQCIDGSLYFSAYIDGKTSHVFRYNLQKKYIDFSIDLEYYSKDIQVCKLDDSIVILNRDRDSSGENELRSIVYATKSLDVEKIYEIEPLIRIYDFCSDSIVCSDGKLIYVYDFEWNELKSFNLVGIPGMMFSGIFAK